jgi:hypothetical protein
MEWEREDEDMSGLKLETDPEQQVDTDGDSGIGDLGSVKYVVILFAGLRRRRRGLSICLESLADNVG